MRVKLGGRTIEAGPGDVVSLPPGAAHRFTNARAQVARAKVEVRPALHMEQLLAGPGAAREAPQLKGSDPFSPCAS
jgi:quercetin dioxygenase-like cupin family protein